VKLIYRQHAIKRMFERNIKAAEVAEVMANGHAIEDYPSDTPYPSCLWLGYSGERPLHVVFAENLEDGERVIITVYEPDPAQWTPDFTKRIKP
jgi:hypothetical protein